MKFGITERGDAALDHSWIPWVESGKPAILITKDPGKLPLAALNDNTIIQCTITGHGHSRLEPNTPYAAKALLDYAKIAYSMSSGRCVLRIDPVVPEGGWLDLAAETAGHAIGRVRISFLDMYHHVRARFKNTGIGMPCCYRNTMLHAPLKLRQQALNKLTDVLGFEPEVCGEPGMKCTGCISERDYKALGLEVPDTGTSKQRGACACLDTKHELLSKRGRCDHKCLYCYWK